MFRPSHRFLHTPSIRFTYALAKSCRSSGILKASAAGVGASTTKPPAEGAAVRTIFESFDELPAHLRPHVFEEAEMETIHMGGAASYVPKHLQKKKK
ncbi:hypothetical protein LSCM1_02006 [Leishmania martiniquensis]|uniref:Uncharacterized protein n=1 Tax=Leishmania martiniquensis TaxID=1580590 RepID=A0A836FWS5_9TRYP|nr:hypothetical protein LSCM1_02006 [Leishmania martiniquensis]